MTFNGYTATDFKIKEVRRNECDGCFFINKLPNCTAAESTNFVKEVFKQHPGNKTGSCVRLVAVLNDEVNK